MKRIGLITILFANAFNGVACNMCACSANSQYLGTLPGSADNLAGIQYQHRSFFSTHEPEGKRTEHINSSEAYNTYQLWAKYHITKHVQVFAFVPYIMNRRREQEIVTNVSGIGDITLLGTYRILRTGDADRKFNHTLLAGAGVKLPTGKHDYNSIWFGTGLPNMQPGTATYDFLLNTNYTVQRNKTGMNIDASYTLTTADKYRYKYGNRLNAGLLFYNSFNKSNMRIVPLLGCRYESAVPDYKDRKTGLKDEMSGGRQIYATAGLQMSYKMIGLQCMYSRPVYQDYADGMINNRFKTEAGVYCLF